MKLIFLSQSFYSKYSGCKEILTKNNRPYACLKITVQGKDFAIPLRHNICHKYAFMTIGKCGLDYTKAVPILDLSFIDTAIPTIDSAEFKAIKSKDREIERGMSKYIEVYKKARQHMESTFYQNIVKYSALQYFDDEIK